MNKTRAFPTLDNWTRTRTRGRVDNRTDRRTDRRTDTGTRGRVASAETLTRSPHAFPLSGRVDTGTESQNAHRVELRTKTGQPDTGAGGQSAFLKILGRVPVSVSLWFRFSRVFPLWTGENTRKPAPPPAIETSAHLPTFPPFPPEPKKTPPL